jgi:hypothetical protein
MVVKPNQWKQFYSMPFKIINIKKQVVVQQEASKFIRKLFLKLAFDPSFHVFVIHCTKNKTIGNMQNVNMKKNCNRPCSSNVKNIAAVAKAKTIPQKTNVPFLPNL